MAGQIQTLDGEVELWRGAPDWNGAGWTTQEKVILSVAVLLFAASVVFGIVLSDSSLVIAIAPFALLYGFLLFIARYVKRRDVEYVLTDRRVIIARSRPEERISIPLPSVSTIALIKRGQGHDINLLTNASRFTGYIYANQGGAKLYALANAGGFENALLSRLEAGHKQ
ncbi:MAG: hypothetical protein R3C58_05220 [Parvularculaceae bacterium]